MKDCEQCINYVDNKCSICQKANDCAFFMSYEMLFKTCYKECNGCKLKSVCDKEKASC